MRTLYFTTGALVICWAVINIMRLAELPSDSIYFIQIAFCIFGAALGLLLCVASIYDKLTEERE